jgi:uncharacterized protein
MLYQFGRDPHSPTKAPVLPTLLLLAAAVAVGAAAQRCTGIGFSLVVAPVCAVALLPDAGLGTLVRLSLMADVAVLVSERASVEWRAVRHLLGPAALAVPVALVVGAVVPGPTMTTVAGLATLGAAGVMVAGSFRPTPTATATAVPASGCAPVGASARAAGFAAGFMGVTTGMPGPPLALHACRAPGPLATDRASMVVLFLVVDLVATLTHPRSLPTAQLGVLAVAVLAGLAGGTWLTGRVDERRLRTALVVVVTAGACAGLVHVLS